MNTRNVKTSARETTLLLRQNRGATDTPSFVGMYK